MAIRMVFILLAVLAMVRPETSLAQIANDSSMLKTTSNNFKPQLLIPGVLIGYGAASLTIRKIRDINSTTRNEIAEHNPGHIKLDNYTQYVPAVLVFGLDALGLKAKHSLKDRAIVFATSQLLSTAMVTPLKHLTHEERPDGSSNLSFPSGHTTTAFSTAQFMFREYKDEHFWLSISGYGFAVFTGVYRTLNNRHWVGDVVAGAGFGILSTELSYWLLPKIKRTFGKKGNDAALSIAPWYRHGALGVGLVYSITR